MTTHPQPRRQRQPPRRAAAGRPAAPDLALLAARLTPRDRWIARMLAEHRVLTTHHLVGLAFRAPRPAQLRLATLTELGVITGFQPLHGPAGSRVTHWVLDTAGHAVLAAEDGHPPPRQQRHSTAAATAIAHNQQLGHQLGVNTCLTDLAKNTLHHPDTRLDAWWGQARCTRHFGDHTHPDAYLLLTNTPTPATTPTTASAGPASGPWGGYRLAAFVEYDTGTETLHRLAAKLAGYHRLTAATAINTPLLFHLPTPAREHNARAALTRALADLDDITCLRIATTHPAQASPGHPARTGTRRTTHSTNPRANARATPAANPGEWSPHTPAWTPLHPTDRHLSSQRVSLADLAILWTPTHPHHTHLDTTHPNTTADSPRFELAAPPPTPPPNIPSHPAQHDHSPRR